MQLQARTCKRKEQKWETGTLTERCLSIQYRKNILVRCMNPLADKGRGAELWREVDGEEADWGPHAHFTAAACCHRGKGADLLELGPCSHHLPSSGVH